MFPQQENYAPKKLPEKVPRKSGGGALRRASRLGDQAGGRGERERKIAVVAAD